MKNFAILDKEMKPISIIDEKVIDLANKFLSVFKELTNNERKCFIDLISVAKLQTFYFQEKMSLEEANLFRNDIVYRLNNAEEGKINEQRRNNEKL